MTLNFKVGEAITPWQKATTIGDIGYIICTDGYDVSWVLQDNNPHPACPYPGVHDPKFQGDRLDEVFPKDLLISKHHHEESGHLFFSLGPTQNSNLLWLRIKRTLLK